MSNTQQKTTNPTKIETKEFGKLKTTDTVITGITLNVDSKLNETSENLIQNMVITKILNEIDTQLVKIEKILL